MIIDCHTHLNNYADEERDALAENLDALQISMRRNRVDVSLVLTSYKVVPGRPGTAAVVAATRHLSNVYVVAGINQSSLNGDTLDELRGYLQEGSVRGLKLYPGYEPYYPHEGHLTPVYHLAAEFGVPVMIHCGDTLTPKGKLKYAHPLHVDDVAVDFPEVNFIICHLGNPWFRDCMEVVYKNRNVYTDISGLVLGNFTDRFEAYMHKQLQEMITYGVEPSKVLYGTDWPISSMESYLEFIEELRIPEKDRRKILWENAVHLFHLTPPETPFTVQAILNRRG